MPGRLPRATRARNPRSAPGPLHRGTWSAAAAKLSTAGALALALTPLALGGCQEQAAPPPPPPTEVGVVILHTEAVPLYEELPGRTVAWRQAEVRPQVGGIVVKRMFEEGSEVQAGQLLYQIDPAPYRATVQEAQAALANQKAAVTAARLRSERYADLAAMEAAAEQEADDAQASYDQTLSSVQQRAAALHTAQIDLEYTKVRSPIDGRIGTSRVTQGALVTASQAEPLTTVVSLDPIFVDMTQSSAKMLSLRKLLESGGLGKGTAEVRLRLEDGSYYEHKGRLKSREVAVDVATGSVTLRAEFDNPDELLLPGMYVRAEINAAVVDQGILAPQRAITRDRQGNAVAFVLDAEDQVQKRKVHTQRAVGSSWLVEDGLSAGDRVIVEGAGKVQPGDHVNPVALGEDRSDARSARKVDAAANAVQARVVTGG